MAGSMVSNERDNALMTCMLVAREQDNALVTGLTVTPRPVGNSDWTRYV